jgi:hypothetical protein
MYAPCVSSSCSAFSFKLHHGQRREGEPSDGHRVFRDVGLPLLRHYGKSIQTIDLFEIKQMYCVDWAFSTGELFEIKQ